MDQCTRKSNIGREHNTYLLKTRFFRNLKFDSFLHFSVRYNCALDFFRFSLISLEKVCLALASFYTLRFMRVFLSPVLFVITFLVLNFKFSNVFYFIPLIFVFLYFFLTSLSLLASLSLCLSSSSLYFVSPHCSCSLFFHFFFFSVSVVFSVLSCVSSFCFALWCFILYSLSQFDLCMILFVFSFYLFSPYFIFFESRSLVLLLSVYGS